MTEPESRKPSADCYSAGERGWMEYGQRLRAIVLHPLLVAMTRSGISPDAVTLAATMIGLAFVPFWTAGMVLPAALSLVVHVLMDGLDGPLARYQQTASSRGSFTDTLADQIVVTGVAAAWMVTSPTPIHIFSGVIYVFLYTLVVAISMVRNALSVPYSWLVRPRFFVYGAVLLDGLAGTTCSLWVLVICNILLAVKLASGFHKLRRAIP